ncbi:MAG: hypothetical protein KDE27_00855 [Planctomycetes bacterium]|nr:hypothetical protein [Planctomycetota bacterium]
MTRSAGTAVRRGVFVAFVAALGVTAWLMLGRDGPRPRRMPEPTGGPVAATDREVESAVTEDTRVEVETARSGPFIENAEGTAVRIVEAATGRVIAGARVCWFDRAVLETIRASDGLFEPSYDPEEVGNRHGGQTTSDANGIARIRRGPGTTVVGRHGALYGRADLDQTLLAPRAGFELALAPDRPLDVRVLTADGAPAIGVWVVLGLRWDTEPSFRWFQGAPIALSREPDGIARIPHLQDLRVPPLSRVELSGRPLAVSTHVAGVDDNPVAVVDLAQLPAEPVELRLPQCGRVRVEVEMPQPWSTAFGPGDRVHLRTYDPNNVWRADCPQVLGTDLTATFGHVGIGKRLVAVASHDPGISIWRVFDGPAVAGAEVRVTLTLGESAGLGARLLDEERRPLANQIAAFALRPPKLVLRTETDAEGRCLALVYGDDIGTVTEPIAIEVRLDDGQQLSAELPARTLRPGIENLGDIVLRGRPRIAAGTCTIDGVPAALPDTLSLTVDPGGMVARTSRADGSFELRGDHDATRLQLRVHDDDLLPVEPIDFVRGTRDLRLDLRRGGRLTATVLLPAGAREPAVGLLRRTDGSDREFEDQADVTTRPGDRQQLDWRRLPAGRYELTIALPGCPPLFTIPDVVVPPPPGGDPRLVDLDARDRVRLQTIRIWGQGSEAVEYAALFPIGQTAEILRGAVSGNKHDNEVAMLLPHGPQTLRVLANGYRATEITCTGAPVDVYLEPWPHVQLQFPDLPALPDGWSLHAGLLSIPDGSAERQWWADRGGGSLDEFTAQFGRSQLVEADRLELPLGEKPATVEVVLRRGRQWLPVAIPEQTIAPGTSTFSVRVPPAAIAAALAAAAADKK